MAKQHPQDIEAYMDGKDNFPTCLYEQVLPLLRQYSHPRDLRHLKALAWIVTARACSGRLSLPEWKLSVPSRARQTQSTERRWQRFMGNRRVRVKSLWPRIPEG